MDEMSFCELKSKEIINELDGRKLGRATDIVFSPQKGCILGIIAPFNRRSFFTKGQEVYIPFSHIIKIGPDVILVRLTSQLSRAEACYDIGRQERRDERREGRQEEKREERREDREEDGREERRERDCDNRCEKCMLFDCDRRWKNKWKL